MFICEVGARLVAIPKCDNYGNYKKHIVCSNNMNSGNDNCSSEWRVPALEF
jgi:hypothetical protein